MDTFTKVIIVEGKLEKKFSNKSFFIYNQKIKVNPNSKVGKSEFKFLEFLFKTKFNLLSLPLK